MFILYFGFTLTVYGRYFGKSELHKLKNYLQTYRKKYINIDKCKGYIDVLYVMDFNNDNYEDILAIEKNSSYFVFYDGKSGRRKFYKKEHFIAVLNLNAEGNYAVLSCSNLAKRVSFLKLTSIKDGETVMSYPLSKKNLIKKDKCNYKGFPFKIMIDDLDNDNIADFLVVSKFGEVVKTFNCKGKDISRERIMVYLPEFIENYDESKVKYIIKRKACVKKEIKADLNYDNIPEIIKFDSSGEKRVIKAYTPKGSFLWRFSFKPFECKRVYMGETFCDVYFSNKEKKFYLGGRNKIFILNEKGELIKVIKNVFY